MTRIDRLTRKSPPAREIVGVGTLWPGVLLRVAVLVVGAGGWAGVVAGRDGGWLVPAAGLALLAAAAWPDSDAPATFLVLIGALQLAVGTPGARGIATVIAAYAVHVLCALAAGVPVDARFEPSVLRPALARFCLVAGGTAVLGCAGWAVAALNVSVGARLLLVTGAGACAALFLVSLLAVRAGSGSGDRL